MPVIERDTPRAMEANMSALFGTPSFARAVILRTDW
jgi:energy-converting hydrogenase Eha subunit A